jgi:hypothetical protein
MTEVRRSGGAGEGRNANMMACAVCKMVLTRRIEEKTGYTEFFHGPEEADGRNRANHVAVPLPLNQVPDYNARCDFCLADHAMWTLPVETYALPDGTGDKNIGDWAACDQCAEWLQEDNWEALAKHAWRGFYVRNGPISTLEAFRLMYANLRPHILGPVYRVN